MPYLPLVYTHPQSPSFYQSTKLPEEIGDGDVFKHPGQIGGSNIPPYIPAKYKPQLETGSYPGGGTMPNRELIDGSLLVPKKQSAKYKPSYPSTTTKKSIPYGCNVDYKVKYDIEKVEYFDEKCETKYK